jgi:hypothetical protein
MQIGISRGDRRRARSESNHCERRVTDVKPCRSVKAAASQQRELPKKMADLEAGSVTHRSFESVHAGSSLRGFESLERYPIASVSGETGVTPAGRSSAVSLWCP